MKILGLDTDSSPVIAEDKSLLHARNIVVVDDLQSYVNENGFDRIYSILSEDIDSIEVCGIISTNIGFVIFFKDITNEYDYIRYYTNIDNTIELIRNIKSKHFNFNVYRPINGDYTYDYKGDLIITFTEGVSEEANETRIINIIDPLYIENVNIDIELDLNNVKLLNIIPDVLYPKLNFSISENGNLHTGAYQVAIRYKLLDGSYTNYSIFHPSIIISSLHSDEDFQLGISISRSIKVSFDNIDSKYSYFSLAILYKDSESERVYDTGDLELNQNNDIIISNISSYNVISLEDVLIHNVSYIKDQCCVNFNNRLIRGNVKTVSYKNIDVILKNISDNIHIGIDYYKKLNVINSSVRYFKSDEVYSLYVGYHDYKGELVNIYKIPNKETDNTKPYENSDRSNHLISKQINKFSVDVDVSNINVYNDEDSKYIYNIFPNILYDNIGMSEIINVDNIYSMYLFNTLEDNIPDIPNNTNIIVCFSDTYNKTFKFNIKNKIQYSGDSNCKLTYNIYETDIRHGGKTLYDTKEIKITESGKEIEINFSYLYEEDLPPDIPEVPKGEVTPEIPEVILKGEYRYFYIEYIIEPIEIIPQEDEALQLYDISIIGIFYKLSYLYLDDNVAVLNVSIPNNYIDLIPTNIKSYSVYMVEHDFSNSKILSQAVVLRDTHTNDMGNNQQYTGQFESTDKLRIYPYEFLFNKKTNIQCSIRKYSNVSDYNIVNDGELIPDTYKCWDEQIIRVQGIPVKINLTKKTTSHINMKVDDIFDTLSSVRNSTSIQYINNNNSQLNNTAGDSFYRYNGRTNDIIDINNKFGVVELINTSTDLYVDEFNQKLEIISSINIIEKNNKTTCKGDTFLSYLTLRASTPGSKFKIGGTAEEASNARVWRWIFTFPIESKFNLKARYSLNSIDKSFKYENTRRGYDMTDLYGINYQVDNFINTSSGKAYSTVYNENGIQNYPYFKNIIGIDHHITRIVRSNVLNNESEILQWRYFANDEYKDIPNNRGAIISLKTDNINLYIQQLYGLRLASIKDVLSNSDSGDSYLGTADLFDREPIEILYDPNGYIGCSNQFDTHINIFGYFVADNKKGRIFHIYGQEPKEISAIKMFNWFKNNISKSDINNPFINKGRYFTFNEDTKNIHYIQQEDTNPFNISFSASLSKWISYHDYNPSYIINNRNGILLFDCLDNKCNIYSINKNKYGIYIDDITYNSIIKFIFNQEASSNKLLQSIAWIDTVSKINDFNMKVILFEETIDSICVHNDDQISGFKIVEFNNKWYSGKTGVNKVNLWRFNNIKDIAKNINFLINPYTINLSSLKVNPKWYDVNEFISRHICVIMKFDNVNNIRRFELNECNAEWTIDNRNNQ